MREVGVHDPKRPGLLPSRPCSRAAVAQPAQGELSGGHSAPPEP